MILINLPNLDPICIGIIQMPITRTKENNPRKENSRDSRILIGNKSRM
jgi:hypothetical protein